MHRESITRTIVVLVAISSMVGATAVYGATSSPAADGDRGPSDKSTADITVTFSDGCTDFHVESSKDISFVSVNYEDENFTYRKFEGDQIRTADHDTDGDDPDGANLQDFSRDGDTTIKSIVVKSGTTQMVFDCPDDSGETNPNPDEEPECSDGMDNDGDGAVDHRNDDGCETPDDDDERQPADGGDGGDGGPSTSCSDGEDNDGDGTIDDEDSECQDPDDGVEDGSDQTDSCSDGQDNDGDGETDGDDTECQDPDDGVEDGSNSCSDGEDNDGDGVTDEEDPECGEHGDGVEDGSDQCSGNGSLATVAVGGQSTGDENADNSDNLIDANVQSDSDHGSDCDTVDADAGTHNTSSDADNDDVDVDVGTNNTAISDDDTVDADVASSSSAGSDDDDVTVPPE